MGRLGWRQVLVLVAVVAAVGVMALSTARVASASSVNPPTSSLTDGFSGTALDTNKWQAGTDTNQTSPPVTVNNQLNISTFTGNGYSFITSKNLYSLRGSSVTTELISAGDQTITSAQVFPMEVVTQAGLSTDTDQGWQIMINQGSFAALQRRDILLGTWHPYDPAVDRYFRISESGGTIHFATSPDGVTWNEFYSYANPGVDIDNVVIRLTAGNWNTETRTTTAVFGNVNITPVPAAPTNSAQVLIPSNGATLSGTALLDGAATNPSAVTTFQYELTGGLYTNRVAATAKPTFYGWLSQEANGTWGWDSTSVPSGTYTLTAVATYSDGTVVTSPGITITVSNPAPTAQVLIPSSGATLSGTTSFDGTASYTQNITRFSYDLDGASVGNAVATPWGWLLLNWNTTTVANGSHTLTAAATYFDGMTATSPGVTVTIANP